MPCHYCACGLGICSTLEFPDVHSTEFGEMEQSIERSPGRSSVDCPARDRAAARMVVFGIGRWKDYVEQSAMRAAADTVGHFEKGNSKGGTISDDADAAQYPAKG